MITILPTDTCYGLAGDFTQEDFYAIYTLKGRSFEKKLAVLVRDFEMLRDFSLVTDEQIAFLQSYPYPWSVLLPKRWKSDYPPSLSGEEYAYISFRVASLLFPYEKAGKISFPLFLTSANRSGEPESETFAQAQRIFPGIGGIDGGTCSGKPSDIFRFGENGIIEYVRKNY